MAVGGAFPEKNLIAELTAKMLLEVEAVQFNSDKPFIFTLLDNSSQFEL